MLRRQFTQTSLLPVRNQIEASAIVRVSPNASMPLPSPDIPLLGFSQRALIDQPSFSFSQFWSVPAGLPQRVDANCGVGSNTFFLSLTTSNAPSRTDRRPSQFRVRHDPMQPIASGPSTNRSRSENMRRSKWYALTTQWISLERPSLQCCKRQQNYRTTNWLALRSSQLIYLISFESPRIGLTNYRLRLNTSSVALFGPKRGSTGSEGRSSEN